MSHNSKSILSWLIFFTFSLFIFNFITVQPVAAQSYRCYCNNSPGTLYPSQTVCNASDNCPNDCSTIGTATCRLDSSGSETKLTNPLPTDKIPDLLGGAIGKALGVVGSIALVLFIYGGFTWMTAGGNTARVTTGRNILIWATIGLIVIFLSFAILQFIFGAIKGT